MSWPLLRKIVSILRESPLYGTLTADEKRSIILELTESYSLFKDDSGEDVVGYESSWSGIIRTNQKDIA
ncbi:MAG: hypothetical protein HQL08_16600 [Nitrospirae bacterium]|nr:hypothetical protein [Nitrospirota bacterium]